MLDDALHELNEADRAAVVLRFPGRAELAGSRRAAGPQRERRPDASGPGAGKAARSARAPRHHLDGLRPGGRAGDRGCHSGPGGVGGDHRERSAGERSGCRFHDLNPDETYEHDQVKASLIGALVVAGVAVPAWQQTRLQRAQSENAAIARPGNGSARPGNGTRRLARRSRSGCARPRPTRPNWSDCANGRRKLSPSCSACAEWPGWRGARMLEAEQLRAQLARQASEAGTNPVSGAMADAMKQAMEQQVEGRLSRLTASLHLTPEQAQAARDILMRQSQVMSAGMQQAFSGKYRQGRAGQVGQGSRQSGRANQGAADAGPESRLRQLSTGRSRLQCAPRRPAVSCSSSSPPSA